MTREQRREGYLALTKVRLPRITRVTDRASQREALLGENHLSSVGLPPEMKAELIRMLGQSETKR